MMHDHDDLPARLMELELKYMEQSALVDELDAVVRAQDLRIDRLERQLHDLQHAGEPDDEG